MKCIVKGVMLGWHLTNFMVEIAISLERCISCGDILDPVILLHRLSQDPDLAIPENEEKIRSLIKKYMSATPKDI